MPLRGVNKIAVKSDTPAVTDMPVASGGGTKTSNSFSGIAAGQNMSAYMTVTGAGGDIKVEVLVSFDNVTFAAPETGSVILASITDQLLHIKAIVIPLAMFFKIKLTNAGGSNVTVAVNVLSQ